MNILISGGAGFIGSRLANFLIARGHRVVVLDNLSPQIHGAESESSPLFCSLDRQVEFIRGSVTQRADLVRALAGVDTVVHLAAETGTGQSMYAIQHYSDVNIGGTALLLDVIANERLPVRKIVVASSRAVYGEGKYSCPLHGNVYPASRVAERMEKGDFSVYCPRCGAAVEMIPTDEETPVHPASVYGITKLTQEQMVLTVGKSLGISSIAFRYQNVYGPGQSLSNPYTGILSIFSTRIRNGSGINIFEDGKESRDFVFIDDVIRATAKAVEYEQPLVDVFNVGSGVATDVLTIANTLQTLLGAAVPTQVTGQFRLGDVRHNVADLAKVRQVLGFEPSVSVEEGLRQFVAWVKGEQIQTDRYEESLKELEVKGLFK
ncbi:MAG: epimerase [Comamonadaceae bacterium CG1_02_60_18]|nr:MAG: epimerase [Comamonadaceae bacterium CG1_02_60_18]